MRNLLLKGLIASIAATVVMGVFSPSSYAAGNCYAGTQTGRAKAFSYCETGAVWANHHVKAKIYINSGYSTWATGPSKPRGAFSWTGDYTAQGYIMDGPWVCTISGGNEACLR